MLNLIATMHVFTTAFQNRVKEIRSEERGSVTLEQVIISVLLIAVAAILVGALTNFVTAESGKLVSPNN